MECAERDRLMKGLRTASHELAWALEEECRLMIERDLTEVSGFAAILDSGFLHRRFAMEAYRNHVQEHGCLASSQADDLLSFGRRSP